MEYSDEKWAQIEPYIPPDKKGPRGQGRPSQHKPRIILEAIAHKLRSGCRWKDLPPCFPPYQTVHRTFQKWRQAGAFRNIARELGEKLFKLGKIKPKEAFIDGTFASAKKGGAKSAKPKKAKAQK